jgi:NADPH:quinone reductase-like Zn-dependent oxidoreductase
MKAIVQDRYGSPDVLECRDVDPPVPGPGEVLVRVRAAAANALDWHTMRGDPYLARLAMGLRRPKEKVRGRDFAGVVEAVGRDVDRLRSGDEVYGTASGTFAELVSARAVVERKPANLSFEQAAAMPVAGITALQGLRDLAGLGPGRRVLINGASGGVGTFAVQIAKVYGAEVTGVCSTRNAELVGSLGADHVIDYTAADFTRGGPYDVVFDLVGNRSLSDLRRPLTPTGTVVLSGGGVSSGGSVLGPLGLIVTGRLQSRFVKHRVLELTAKPTGADLATLRELAESGRVTPVVDRTYPLEEAAEAIRYLEVDHARAKVVITVSS